MENPVIYALITLVISFVNNIAGINNKFAKTKNHAIWSNIFLYTNILLIALFCWMVYLLKIEVLSLDSLNRASFLKIIIMSFSLFYMFISFHLQVILWFISRIITVIESMLKD